MARFVGKAALVGSLILVVSLPATAQSIEFPGDNDQYWKSAEPITGGSVEEFTARCQNSSISSLEVGESPVPGVSIEDKNEVTIKNSDLSGVGESGSLNIDLECEDGSEENSQLEIATLRYSIDDTVARYESTVFGRGQALPGDPPVRAPVLNVSVNGDELVTQKSDLRFKDFGNAFDGANTELVQNSVQEPLQYRLSPHESGDEGGIYSAEIVYEPSKGEQVSFELKDATQDSESPEVKILDTYRVSSVSSTLSEGSFQSYNALGDLTYTFRLTENGESVTPESSDPPQRRGYVLTTVETVDELGEDGQEYAEYVEKNWFSRPTYLGGGRWNTTLDNSPVLEAGLYRFVTELRIPGTSRTVQLGEIFVERNMNFDGRVVDSSSSRSPIDATFRFFDGGTKENDFSTSPDGTYTSRVDRKTYDSVEMDFYDERSRSSATESFDARVTASDVEVGDNQGSVRFDYFRNPSVSIPGISPVNMMATQFGYDVGGVTEIEMAYNSGRVSVEKAQVFECRNWNYFARSCQEDWERLDEDDYDVNPVSEQVSITGAEPYVLPEDLSGSRNSQRILKNAYVVGTAADLGLEGDIEVGAEDGRAPVGSDISVSGNVVAGGGVPVANADVTANLSIGQEEYGSGTAQTDADGRFSVSLEVPESPGNYTVSLTAEKQPYSSFSESFDQSLTAYVEKGVRVSLKGVTGGQLSLVKGREIGKKIEVSNTGQRPVKDVEISLSDLDDDFYNLSSARINKIPEGETRSVSLDILIPETFALNQFPSFTVSAQGSSDGKQVSSEAQIFTVVNQVSDIEDRNDSTQTEARDNSSSSSATQDSSNLLGSFSGAPSLSPELPSTGNFAGQTSDVNLILGLVFVFLLVVAAAVKKRDSGSGGERRRISHDRPAVTSVSASPTDLAGGSGATGSGTTVEGEDSNGGPASRPSGDENVCGECGEEFDTNAALEMHREAAH